MLKWSYFFLLIFTACANNPMTTGVRAERNIVNISNIQKGMTMDEACKILKRPYKKETRIQENKRYEIWYYITKKAYLSQTSLLDKNFTPIVFSDGVIIGWGWNFYDYLFDVGNTRKKIREEKRQQYTEDREEWPPNEHKIILPKDSKDSSD